MTYSQFKGWNNFTSHHFRNFCCQASGKKVWKFQNECINKIFHSLQQENIIFFIMMPNSRSYLPFYKVKFYRNVLIFSSNLSKVFYACKISEKRGNSKMRAKPKFYRGSQNFMHLLSQARNLHAILRGVILLGKPNLQTQTSSGKNLYLKQPLKTLGLGGAIQQLWSLLSRHQEVNRQIN